MNAAQLNYQSIGLVLSGGGVRGMAHIGLLKALGEFGIVPQTVSGSSVGALVGALYANGNSIDEMLFFLKKPLCSSIIFLPLQSRGLLIPISISTYLNPISQKIHLNHYCISFMWWLPI